MSNRKWLERLQMAVGGIFLDDNSLITEKGVVFCTMSLQVMLVNTKKPGSKSLGKFRENDTEGSLSAVITRWNEAEFPSQ